MPRSFSTDRARFSKRSSTQNENVDWPSREWSQPWPAPLFTEIWSSCRRRWQSESEGRLGPFDGPDGHSEGPNPARSPRLAVIELELRHRRAPGC